MNVFRILLLLGGLIITSSLHAQSDLPTSKQGGAAIESPKDDLKDDLQDEAKPTAEVPPPQKLEDSPASTPTPAPEEPAHENLAPPVVAPPGIRSSVLDDEAPPRREILAGLIFDNFSYSESISGGASNETGILPLVWVRTSLPERAFATSFTLNIDLSFTYQTNTNYSGTTLSSNNAVSSTDLNDFLNLKVTAEVPITDSWSFDGGLGYRYWKRSITQGGGYNEYYTHQMIPLGLKYYFFKVDEDSDSHYEISISGHYDTMINPQMRVVFSDTVISGQNSSFKLGARDGYDLNVEIKGKFNDDWWWDITPYYDSFGYGNSGEVYNATPVIKGTSQGPLGNILEPSSQTQDLGIKLGAIYKF